jgi:hypothetical protein
MREAISFYELHVVVYDLHPRWKRSAAVCYGVCVVEPVLFVHNDFCLVSVIILTAF